MQKVPYMMVIGDKEVESDTISLRKRKEGNIGMLKIKEVMLKLQEEVKGLGSKEN
jgi:threonyl-tRNA synthetase